MAKEAAEEADGGRGRAGEEMTAAGPWLERASSAGRDVRAARAERGRCCGCTRLGVSGDGEETGDGDGAGAADDGGTADFM